METQIQVGADSKRLDGLAPQQLIAEIQQIAAQYEEEVPGKRRHWPESIRNRVLALGRLGVTPSKVASLTPVPKTTLFLWYKQLPNRRPARRTKGQGEFIQVSGNPTVGKTQVSSTVKLNRPVDVPEGPTVLVTPEGFRIEFSAWRTACAAYRELRVEA
jgi:hypothetical protein